MAPALDTAAAVIILGVPPACEALPMRRSSERIPAAPTTATMMVTIRGIKSLRSFLKAHICSILPNSHLHAYEADLGSPPRRDH